VISRNFYSKSRHFPTGTVWKFQNFTATQILRENNFGDVEPPKNCHFDQFLGIFDVFKCEITQKSKFKASKIVKMTVFQLLISAKLISRQFGVAGKVLSVEITKFTLTLFRQKFRDTNVFAKKLS